MKRTLCVFLALFLAISLLSVPALADGEDRSFEPVTVVDDESVKVVVTDLVNSPEEGSGSFTLEITNKTEIGLEFSLTGFSANERLCPLSWVNVSIEQQGLYGEGNIALPAGETGSVSAGWDMPALAQVGVNYVQSAEGYLSAQWSNDFYMEKYDAIGDDMDALMDLESQRQDFELLVPISLPFSAVNSDIPATEDVIYDTDFEPIAIIDDEGVTAIVHDFYYNHSLREYSDMEVGPCLVMSIENRTGEMLRTNIGATVDGAYGQVNSSDLLPPGKTMIEAMNMIVYGDNGWVELTSVNNIQLHFALLDNDYVVYGNYMTDLDMDVSPYADVTSSVHGTAAWVADPTPPETQQPTEETAEEDAPPAGDESADLIWVPDPEANADAMVTLGDNGEYLLGVLKDEKTFPGITFYIKNNGDKPIDWIEAAEVLVDGESADSSWGIYGGVEAFQSRGAANFLLQVNSPLPSEDFTLQIELVCQKASLDATVTVSFAEDGSATIEQVA